MENSKVVATEDGDEDSKGVSAPAREAKEPSVVEEKDVKVGSPKDDTG